jgi:sensor histidine kinase regulating citrate/malate metabolism
MGQVKVAKLFQKTMFGIFLLFALIAVSTSALCVYTVDRQLSAEYEANSSAIAQTIANSSMDIILNRDLATLQSLIDQFKEIQGIRYIYIVNEEGDFLAHTFVPGIPREILAGDRLNLATIDRRLPGFGEFIEVSSPILDGIVGSVHVGMDKGLIALKIQTAIGQQVYLISIIFIVSVVGSYLLVNLAARPLARLGGYARLLAAPGAPATITPEEAQALLERNDEVGQMARLYRYLALHGGTDAPPSTTQGAAAAIAEA